MKLFCVINKSFSTNRILVHVVPAAYSHISNHNLQRLMAYRFYHKVFPKIKVLQKSP